VPGKINSSHPATAQKRLNPIDVQSAAKELIERFVGVQRQDRAFRRFLGSILEEQGFCKERFLGRIDLGSTARAEAADLNTMKTFVATGTINGSTCVFGKIDVLLPVPPRNGWSLLWDLHLSVSG